MTDKTKLIKAQNNLIEFIEDKSKDLYMLLRTQEQIDTNNNPKSYEEIVKIEEKKGKEWDDVQKSYNALADVETQKKGEDAIYNYFRKQAYQNLGSSIYNKLYIKDDGIKFILNNSVEDIDKNKIYSGIIKRYAQKLEFPWDDGFDNEGKHYMSKMKFPKLRPEVVSFMSLLKKYLLIAMKEKFNVLTLDIIPDSQNTLLGIFTLGNKVNEKIQIEATYFFQEQLEKVFEDVFINDTSEHYNLKTNGFGNNEIKAQIKLNKLWFERQKEVVERLLKDDKKDHLKKIKKVKEYQKYVNDNYSKLGISSEKVKKLKKADEKIINLVSERIEENRRNTELWEYEIEVNKEFFIKAKKCIDNNSYTLDKYLKLQEEWDDKLLEHPFAEVNTPIIKNYDPSIKIKPIFIERSKRQRFETVAEKRLSNIEKSISTFNNFFSKTNVANYDFTKDDMIGIDERITKSINQFRLNYEQFFASNPDKEVKKNSKIEKYKKNIDGTDPSVIQNIREKMKGGD